MGAFTSPPSPLPFQSGRVPPPHNPHLLWDRFLTCLARPGGNLQPNREYETALANGRPLPQCLAAAWMVASTSVVLYGHAGKRRLELAAWKIDAAIHHRPEKPAKRAVSLVLAESRSVTAALGEKERPHAADAVDLMSDAPASVATERRSFSRLARLFAPTRA